MQNTPLKLYIEGSTSLISRAVLVFAHLVERKTEAQLEPSKSGNATRIFPQTYTGAKHTSQSRVNH